MNKAAQITRQIDLRNFSITADTLFEEKIFEACLSCIWGSHRLFTEVI